MTTMRVGKRKKSPGRSSYTKRVARLRKHGRRRDLEVMADRQGATNKKLTRKSTKQERLENAALRAWLVKALRQGGLHKRYVLSKADSEILLKALDRPPRAKPALKRLFRKKFGRN